YVQRRPPPANADHPRIGLGRLRSQQVGACPIDEQGAARAAPISIGAARTQARTIYSSRISRQINTRNFATNQHHNEDIRRADILLHEAAKMRGVGKTAVSPPCSESP